MRYLRAVADSDSLTGAAGLLRLTTPAIRSQLRGLEDLAGCALMVRAVQKAGHGAFRPTPAGMALLLAESQVATALAVPDATSAPCSRAVWETWFWTLFPPASIFAPGLIACLLRLLPQIEATLRIGNRDTQL